MSVHTKSIIWAVVLMCLVGMGVEHGWQVALGVAVVVGIIAFVAWANDLADRRTDTSRKGEAGGRHQG